MGYQFSVLIVLFIMFLLPERVENHGIVGWDRIHLEHKGTMLPKECTFALPLSYNSLSK